MSDGKEKLELRRTEADALTHSKSVQPYGRLDDVADGLPRAESDRLTQARSVHPYGKVEALGELEGPVILGKDALMLAYTDAETLTQTRSVQPYGSRDVDAIAEIALLEELVIVVELLPTEVDPVPDDGEEKRLDLVAD